MHIVAVPTAVLNSDAAAVIIEAPQYIMTLVKTSPNFGAVSVNESRLFRILSKKLLHLSLLFIHAKYAHLDDILETMQIKGKNVCDS